MTAAHPEKNPRWSIWHLTKLALLALALVPAAYAGWREYDYHAAIREAQAAGFGWESNEPFDVIRADWRAAFRTATWVRDCRRLVLKDNLYLSDLTHYRPLLQRLRPTEILLDGGCVKKSIMGLKGLTGLEVFDSNAYRGRPAASRETRIVLPGGGGSRVPSRSTAPSPILIQDSQP